MPFLTLLSRALRGEADGAELMQLFDSSMREPWCDPGNSAWLWHQPAQEFACLGQDEEPCEAQHSAVHLEHIDFGGSDNLPERARELLSRHVSFSMSRTALWPAAEARWGSAVYLAEELAGLEEGVHVLGNTSRLKDFSYFKVAGDEWERPCVARLASTCTILPCQRARTPHLRGLLPCVMVAGAHSQLACTHSRARPHGMLP